MEFNLGHVYESQQFDKELMDYVFSVSDEMKKIAEGGYSEILKGKIMASLFYEPSTRTRFSFEAAMYKLGGNVITTENAKEFSSAAKGETIQDSIRIMNGYSDVIVLRHNVAGSAKEAAMVSRAPVINGGDGAGQHPTQALLDMYTLKTRFGRIEGLKIAMVGDMKYGRTVRSLSYLLAKYKDVKIYFVSPDVCRMEDDIKEHLTEHGIEWEEVTDLDAILPEVDCVYMTRIQKERFHDPEQYKDAAGKYILTLDNVRTMKESAIIMHPLPRVDEISPDVDGDKRAMYYQQAQNGLYVRMALLKLLLGK